MIKSNIVLKETGILLIVSIITFSSIAVSGDTNILEGENEKYFTFSNVGDTGIILWDNDMNYDYGLYAVWDEVNNIDYAEGDDFSFSEDTLINDVHWVGGYTWDNYQNGDFDWSILFFYDQGDGFAPGVFYKGPYIFPQDQCKPVILEDTGTEIFIEFSVILPEIIQFNAYTKYWISIWGVGMLEPISIWAYHFDPITYHQAVIGSNYDSIPYWTNTDEVFWTMYQPVDMCFQLTQTLPDLNCEGDLTWLDVKPGSTVTGTIEIFNNGDTDSLLDWEITDYPVWGTWIFEPENGEDLTPESGSFTINVTVTAPDTQNENFLGDITIINTDYTSDFCNIDVVLTTPKNKPFVFNFPLLCWLFDRFPNAFSIFRNILGL